MHSVHRTRAPAVAVVLAGFLSGTLAACSEDAATDSAGGGSLVSTATPRGLVDVPPTQSATASEPGDTDAAGESPAEAYAARIAALARRDAVEACERQAPEFTIALRQEAILEHRAGLGDPCVDFEAILWETPDFQSEVVDVSVTQRTSEDALLAVALGPAEGTQRTVRMVRHRARWRVFSEAPRSADKQSARWVESWCDLDASMGRAEIVALMGAPSGEYTVADGGEPQLWWAQDQYDFRVYLDIDGSVLDLVGDYDALSEADRAELTCPELR